MSSTPTSLYQSEDGGEDGATSALTAVLDMAPESRDTAWTPGLPTLRAQQRDLIQRLRDGFDSRRSILLWTHAVAAVSLGLVSDEWFGRLFSLGNRYRLAALLAAPGDRAAMCSSPPDESTADFVRDDVQQATLSGAFQRARSELRANAGDYTDGDDGVSDTDNQRFLAMRPRVHQIVVEQHNAILDAFSGFDSRRQVLDWVDHVDYATTGYLDQKFVDEATAMHSEWWHLLTASDDRSVWLEARLAQEVLPACNRAIREAVRTGEEAPKTADLQERNVGAEDAY